MAERCLRIQDSLHIILMIVCTYSLGATCQTQDGDGIEGGRQLIQELYNNFSAHVSYTTLTSVSNPVDLIFVLDRSASATDSGWQSMLRFVQNFLEHFTIDADNTRVAVISYSTTASVDIDGLRSGEHNKCAFGAKLQRQLGKKVPSGYSATHEALLRAKDVVLTSRANAKKAVIVITCGKSNVGPPPVRASIQLRSLSWNQGWDVTSEGPQLQIYAFGIKSAYMPEVCSIATPLPNHTFYIPTFQAFAELARSLHDDSQSENWHVLGNSAPCHGICDKHAYCACGTRSGQYLCICKYGYQGDGTTCKACPRGSYKTTISPSRCVLCPSNSTTLLDGAADVKLCVCPPPLYQDYAGRPCNIRHCPDLPEIEHGHKFHVAGHVVDELPDTGTPCQNCPDSSCHYQCDIGYRLDGYPGLVCHSNGSWRGDVPSCHIVDCATLSYHQQESGDAYSVEYLNQTTTFNSVVRVECHQGWRAFGDIERICSPYGTWSGTQTWCVESQCPALLLTSGLIITPPSCGQAAQVSAATCQYMCELGYELTGPSQVNCTEHGTWTPNTSVVCVDRQPPSIICPDDLTTPVTTANFAVIHWRSYPPLAEDNSGEFIITGIGVTDSGNPLHLTAGFHQIKYIARDKAGNEASCVQEITVLNFTVHLVACPESDVTINMTNHQQEAVWPEVIFADPNNLTVAHKCVPTNNTLLPAGIYTVMCVPDTHSYQQTHCQFRAIFRQPKCDIPPAPLHGSVSCSSTPESLLRCVPHCNLNFDFHYLPQTAYICDLDGNWNLQNPGHFWPDCSRTYVKHKAVIQGLAKYFYYGGRCEDRRIEIAEMFTEFLENQTWEVCGAETCSVQNVKVYCGSEPRRKRRSPGKEAPERTVKVHQKHQIDATTPLMGLPLQGSLETVFIKDSQGKSSEGARSDIFKTLTGFVSKGRRMKQSDSDKSTVRDINNLSYTYMLGQQETGKIGKPMLSGRREDLSKSSSQIRDAESAIRRHLYQIDKAKMKNTHQGILQNHNGVSSVSVNRIRQTDKGSNCSQGDTKYDIQKDTRPPSTLLGTFVASETTRQVHEPDKLLHSDVHRRESVIPLAHGVPETGRKGIVITKRSVGRVMSDLVDSNDSTDSQVDPGQGTYVLPSLDYLQNNVTQNIAHNASTTDPQVSPTQEPDVMPSLDYFLINVTPPNENEDTNEVEIEFEIHNEVANTTVDKDELSKLLLTLIDVNVKLSQSLESHNLVLHDNNVTSSTSTNNNTNILFADQHSLESPDMGPCDFGYVTPMNSMPSLICVACPAGSSYDLINSLCLACRVGYYQPQEAQSQCLSCPDAMMTQFHGAHNSSMCLAMCDPGHFSGTGLAPCQLCPLHSYQPFSSASTCLPCPMDRKTLTTGTVHATNCLDLCMSGTYSETGLVPCTSCPVGAYQADHGATECLLCDDGMSTATGGASNISECFAWDACYSQDWVCENGGQCVVQNNLTACVCTSGFSGISCQINVPDCLESSCQNNGTCVDGINRFTCNCWPGFTGTHCEVNIDSCLSSPCHNGSSCLSLINDYQCFCSYGYTGTHCQTKMALCDEDICVHGICQERNGAPFCVCNPGFAGNTCNVTYDLCSSHPCAHAGECVSTMGEFRCRCLPRFTGTLCDTVLDLCANSNCSRASTCVPAHSSQLGYLCKCHGGWSGEFCEREVAADFDLVFNTDGPDGQYVVLPPEMMPSLLNFSVCTWLRPQPMSAFATIVAFTLPLSSVTLHDNDYNTDREFDTIFTLRHTDKLIVDIFDHSLSTNVSLTFYVWSHLCVTWSCESSHWEVLVNGSLSAEGSVGHLWPSLPSHVHLVIGQNNPFYAEPSMMWDVYSGEITQLNIFSYVLSLADLRELTQGTTCNQTFGDVISWTDVVSYIKGDLVLRQTSHCLDINECWFLDGYACGNNRKCEDLIDSYDCSSCQYGYTGSDCQYPDDECAMDNCVQGECVDGPEPYDFRCICPPGYTGSLCEEMMDLCLSAPCQNGGTCLPGANSFSCSCPSQHMGPACERPGSACLPNPCQNSGICLEQRDDTFECSCPESFTGRVCKSRMYWCEENVCHNGGVCQNHSLLLNNGIPNDNYCQCHDGWIGRQCQVRMLLSCDLSPCVNGGSCIPSSNNSLGYTCQCPDIPNVKLDENCEYLNPCHSSPCNYGNNTLCVSFPNYTFVCLCAGGWPCDQPVSNTTHHYEISSQSSQWPEVTLTAVSDAGLISDWMWALAGLTSIFILLVVGITSCFLWRRMCKRLHREMLNNTPDVARGHITNPGFQLEELQHEESIYAELGDDYNFPEDDLGSSQSSMKSTNLQRTETLGYLLALPSGSHSSLQSSQARKACREDNTDQPLLSDDYLEPVLLGLDMTRETKLVTSLDNNSDRWLARSGITNAGFDPGDYVISDMTRSRQNMENVKMETGSVVVVDSPSQADRVSYVNEHSFQSELAHNRDVEEGCGEDRTVVRGTSDIRTLPEYDTRQVLLAEASNVNFSPGFQESESKLRLHRHDLDGVHNTGYIPFNVLSAGRLDKNSQSSAVSSDADK